MIKNLAIGETLKDAVFALKSLCQKNDRYIAVLSDKTGEQEAILYSSRFDKKMMELVGGAVAVNGVVVNGDNMRPEVRIKSMCKAPEGSFKPSDLFDGLDEEHIKLYTKVIREIISKIPDEHCRKLCQACLTDKAIAKLATMPATIAYHGKYRGGALAAAAVVTKLVTQSGAQYQKLQNGLYKPSFNWSCLMAASLLHTYGVLKYYTDQPWKKTPTGLDRGYMSVLQSSLEDVVRANKIDIPENQFSKILNILGCSVSMKTSVKASSSEGVLFRHCLMLYEELDLMDAGLAEHETTEGEGYFFNRSLRRAVLIREEKGGAA